MVASVLNPSDLAASGGERRRDSRRDVSGVALAPATGFTVGGNRNVDVRASGDGGHLIVMSLAVCVTTGWPGAELPASSGTEHRLDGRLSRPRGLFDTTK